jgi:hypothetical protein
MALQVVGAGLGRTGTHSLKLALETLLDGPTYHMMEVFSHRDHVPLWQAAIDGERPEWERIFDGYVATVDWPGAAFWRELAAAYPDALVLLSRRDDADAWWRSAQATIFQDREVPPDSDLVPWRDMVEGLFAHRFTPEWADERSAKAAYEEHLAEVRTTVAPERLLEWRPGDGWEPLCAALNVPVPATPFPHTNTTAEFHARMADGPPR